MEDTIQFLACQHCQFENHSFSRFCLACGLPLEGAAALVRSPGAGLEGLDPTLGAAPPTRKVQDFVRGIAEGLGLEVSPAGNGWKIGVALPGNRSQRVFVHFSGVDAEGDEVISFVSLAAPANPVHAFPLLRLNETFHYCRVAVLEVQGQQVYGVMAKQLAATADDAEVQKMLLEVARQADALEDRLTGGADHY